MNNGIEEYKRRIERFNDIMTQSKKLYFIYINEDYLYDNTYRNLTFNDSIFNEMLELESFLKEKYPNIDYAILYFNFIKHNIPPSSNIINIVLNTKQLYDTIHGSSNEPMRTYCAQILTGLFKSKLSLGYNSDTFNN